MTETLMVKENQGQIEEKQQFVTFYLNEEAYAIEALSVQEIIELTNITKVPHLPGFLKGVINLRGTIVPVVDLKMKFGMHSEGYKKHTCVIVTEFTGGVMGLIVDAVSDVLAMSEETISEPPSFGARIKTEFIKGMGRFGDDLVIILDVDRVLTDEEVSVLSEAKEAQ
ncbi:MAG TPA: purine-binding chemotaxis protein CheW [Nitrospirae bacterium]|nr:purine-binding chemotaxis protein CheW [Nitrospirota bacterium]